MPNSLMLLVCCVLLTSPALLRSEARNLALGQLVRISLTRRSLWKLEIRVDVRSRVTDCKSAQHPSATCLLARHQDIDSLHVQGLGHALQVSLLLDIFVWPLFWRTMVFQRLLASRMLPKAGHEVASAKQEAQAEGREGCSAVRWI